MQFKAVYALFSAVSTNISKGILPNVRVSFFALNSIFEIRKRTDGEKDIDNVTRILRFMRKVSTIEFIAVTEKVLGGKSKVLATPLLL